MVRRTAMPAELERTLVDSWVDGTFVSYTFMSCLIQLSSLRLTQPYNLSEILLAMLAM